MVRFPLAWILILLTAASCGGDPQRVEELETRISQLEAAAASTTTASSTSSAAATTGSTGAITQPEPAAPRVELAWFWSSPDTDSPLFRLLALLTNPNDRPLAGVETHWEVYDASGALVGSHSKIFPALPPGVAFPYVAGAGSANLTGTPTTAELFVDDAGQLADVDIEMFTVDDVAFSPEQGIGLDAPVEYLVTASITTGSQDVSGSSIIAVVILKDNNGKVVGADFTFPSTIPDLVRAGTTFRIEATFVPATGSATAVEVFAYSEP